MRPQSSDSSGWDGSLQSRQNIIFQTWDSRIGRARYDKGVSLPLIYLHGFASGPSSSKARLFAERFAAAGRELAVPALDGGDFRNLTISGMLRVVEREAAGRRCALIGSSLGGYLAALYAARHVEVERVVLLAPAFGFARRWAATLGLETLDEWQRTGVRKVFHYGMGGETELSWRLMEDASLYEEFPDVKQPALVMHGVRDDVVPAEVSRQFAARTAGAVLREFDSDHQLLDVAEEMFREMLGFLG